jgi:hypothetical protein
VFFYRPWYLSASKLRGVTKVVLELAFKVIQQQFAGFGVFYCNFLVLYKKTVKKSKNFKTVADVPKTT